MDTLTQIQNIRAMLADISARLDRIEGEDAKRQESGTRSPTGQGPAPSEPQ